jgi:TP901 family phage tail tape measure protein
MASIGDIFLRLLLDDADFQKQVVKRAEKAGQQAGMSMGAQMAAGLSKGATAIGQSLSKIGAGLTKTGRAMFTNLTLPLLGAGAAVTHFALDFDTKMRQIVALSDVTQEEIGGIREEILKMAGEVGRSPQELANSFYYLASSGLSGATALKTLETAGKAAATGMGRTEDIAKVLASTINAYGAENITAARAGDVLTAAVRDGAAEASDFAGVVGRVVPLAAALGVSFDQVTAALAGMTLVGVDADEAATSLVQIFSSLLKPTVQAEGAMKDLGLTSAGLRQELKEKGLIATLRTLEAAFAGNETASSLVFGNIRALRGITALLTLDEDQLNKVFADTSGALGDLDQAYKETEGPQRRLDRAMADMQATAIALGEDVLPQVVEVVESIADGLRRLGRWWKSLDADTRKNIIQWLAWVAVAGPALLIIGKLATGLGTLLKVVGFLAGAKGIPGLVGGITKARIGLGLWLVAILAVTEALDAASGPISDFFDTLVSGKKANKVLHELNDLTGDMLKAQVLRAMGIDAKEFAEAIEKAGGDVQVAFDAIKDAGGDLGKALWRLGLDAEPTALFHGWGTRDPTKIQAALDAARQNADGLPEDLAVALVDGQYVVQEAADTGIEDPIAQAMEDARAKSAEQTRGLLDDLAGILATGPEEIKDEVQDLVDALVNPFTRAERSLSYAGALAKNAFRIAFTKDDPKLEVDTFNKINDLLAQYDLLKPGVFDIGKEVPKSLQAGVTSTIDAAVSYFKTKIRPDLIKPFDIADDMDRQGYHVLAEYVRGQERARLEKVSIQAGKILRDTKMGMADDFYIEGYNAGATYAAGLKAGGALAVETVSRFAGKIESLIKLAGSPDYTHSKEAGEGVAKTYMQRMVASIRGALPKLASTIGTLASTLATSFYGVPMGLSAAGVPSVGGMSSMAMPPAPPAAPVTYNLNVTGRIPVDDAQDAVWEMRRLAGIKKP